MTVTCICRTWVVVFSFVVLSMFLASIGRSVTLLATLFAVSLFLRPISLSISFGYNVCCSNICQIVMNLSKLSHIRLSAVEYPATLLLLDTTRDYSRLDIIVWIYIRFPHVHSPLSGRDRPTAYCQGRTVPCVIRCSIIVIEILVSTTSKFCRTKRAHKLQEAYGRVVNVPPSLLC